MKIWLIISSCLLYGVMMIQFPIKVDGPFVFKCPDGKDEKLKLKNVCAVEYKEKKDLEKDPYFERLENSKIYVKKKKCGKHKHCVPNTYIGNEPQNHPYIYTCEKEMKFKDIGESCINNGECLSSKCDTIEGKCIVDEKCYSSDTHTLNDYACDKKKYCRHISDSVYKCEEYAKAGEICQEETDENGDYVKKCEPGYGCALKDGKKGTCEKFGSQAEGTKVLEEEVCQSGQKLDGICIKVTKDGKCDSGKCTDIEINDGKDVKKPVNIECNNNLPLEDETKKICKYSSGKTEAFRYYLDKYDKKYEKKAKKLSKNRMKEPGYWFHFNDRKLRERYISYKYYDILKSQGIIQNDGKREKGKVNKCLYSFAQDYLSTNYLNHNFLLILLGLVLNFLF